MKLLQRQLAHIRAQGKTVLPSTPAPQPERTEPKPADRAPTDLSRRDYLAILKRSVKKVGENHLPNIAAGRSFGCVAVVSGAFIFGGYGG
jgi:hypothetical protein